MVAKSLRILLLCFRDSSLRSLPRRLTKGMCPFGEQLGRSEWKSKTFRTFSPIMASTVRCGVRLRLREQLVSLEVLLRRVGQRPKKDLQAQYTEKWHRGEISRLVVEEGGY